MGGGCGEIQLVLIVSVAGQGWAADAAHQADCAVLAALQVDGVFQPAHATSHGVHGDGGGDGNGDGDSDGEGALPLGFDS